MFLLKKNKDLISKISEYFLVCKKTLNEFYATLEYVLENGIDKHFSVLVEKISEMENDADNIKRFIEFQMISKSLLPETREDLLEIIYLMDNIPDHCEKIVYIINDQKTIPLKAMKDDLLELTKIGLECFEYTIKAAFDFFEKREKIERFVRYVDEQEHIGDKLERKMIQSLFTLKVGTGKKLIQKEIVNEIGEICDISRHISMRIFISSIKRKL